MVNSQVILTLFFIPELTQIGYHCKCANINHCEFTIFGDVSSDLLLGLPSKSRHPFFRWLGDSCIQIHDIILHVLILWSWVFQKTTGFS